MTDNKTIPYFDYIYKYVVIGEAGVGKTSLTRQYVFNDYNDDPYGVDFTFMITSNTVNGEVRLNHRSALREISKGSRINYGFKVESSPVNNLFKSTSFHSLNSKDLFPVMRVIYAIP